MQCRRCRAELPDDAKYCLKCGARQDMSRKPKARGNGTGSVYQMPNRTWKAVCVVGWRADKNGVMRRKTRSKGGFRTKKEALAYLPKLAQLPAAQKNTAPTFRGLYDKWEPTHRAGPSTINCYRAAIKHFRPLWGARLDDIDIDDLQECMDECAAGKRTRENMKALCGLLYKYAVPRRMADINLGQYLIVSGQNGDDRRALPQEAVEKLRQEIGRIPYADYIVAQCYLGFRPSELLALDAADYDAQERAFVGGAKTEAGRDRTVTISPKIQPIIDRLVDGKESGPVFCAADGGPLTLKAYRAAFYEALDAIGLDNPTEGTGGNRRRRYTPHSCRHTFATLLKAVAAPDKDKLELIGHTSTDMLRHYQDVDLAALRRITDAL